MPRAGRPAEGEGRHGGRRAIRTSTCPRDSGIEERDRVLDLHVTQAGSGTRVPRVTSPPVGHDTLWRSPTGAHSFRAGIRLPLQGARPLSKVRQPSATCRRFPSPRDHSPPGDCCRLARRRTADLGPLDPTVARFAAALGVVADGHRPGRTHRSVTRVAIRAPPPHACQLCRGRTFGGPEPQAVGSSASSADDRRHSAARTSVSSTSRADP